MEEILLSLRNISKNFGEGDVLAGISLDVRRGEFGFVHEFVFNIFFGVRS